MLEFNFTQAHQALLEAYLTGNEKALSYPACQGYLFASICSPAGVEVEQWLAVLTANDDTLEESCVFAFMALHHQISEQVFSGQFDLPWLTWAFTEKQAWSQGFLMGIEHFYARLVNATNLTDDMRQALMTATEQLGFFSLEEQQVAQFCEQNALVFDDFCMQQALLASDFAPAYAELIEAAAIESGLYNEEA